MKRLGHPATALAAVALFAALGGGAAWASGAISGAQIKNHSIPASKFTAGAIRTMQGDIVRWNTTGTVRDVVGTSEAPNLSTLADRTGIVTLVTAGTLKVDGICWDDGTNTYAATFIETTRNGAFAQGYWENGKVPLNVADGPIEISEDVASNQTAADSFRGPDDGNWAATNAADSLVIDGFGDQMVPNLGGGASATCRFAGFLTRVK